MTTYRKVGETIRHATTDFFEVTKDDGTLYDVTVCWSEFQGTTVQVERVLERTTSHTHGRAENSEAFAQSLGFENEFDLVEHLIEEVGQ
jgi:hypothetical protein